MPLKVLMYPQLRTFHNDESGIRRVIEAYYAYSKATDIEYVDENHAFDLVVAHAGAKVGADVAISHGLYWTRDYEADTWEWEMNAHVIQVLRQAKEVTVPSNWVAETLRRDMRINPHIIGHGIEWDEWQGKVDHLPYVLWNKNRASDVCSPIPVAILARNFPKIKFFTTFYPPNEDIPNNVRISGVLSHVDMKNIVKSAGIYLSTTKETFGIGVLEAMASGLPVLGFAHGGNLDLVKHGVNGYLAPPNNYEALCNGLNYCLTNAKVLGDNSREMAKAWTWKAACEKLREVYDLAMYDKDDLPLTIPESEYMR